jgi:hypothetical protein
MDQILFDDAAEQQKKETVSNKKKGRIILRNLTKEQRKKLLVNGSTALAGILGGASLMSFIDNAEAISEPEIIIDSNEEPIVIYTEAPFASSVNDSMTFNEAYGAARTELGAGGVFEWKGNTYNTYTKEEWDNLSEEDHQAYYESISENISSIEEVEINNDEINIEAHQEDIDGSLHVVGYSEDSNDDGNPDLVIVEINDDGTVDAAIDIDGDGEFDMVGLSIDVENVTMEGTVDINEYQGNLDVLDLEDIIEVDTDVDDQHENNDFVVNEDIDDSDTSDLNPSYDIDYDADMNEFV